jgi:hypothetical protein
MSHRRRTLQHRRIAVKERHLFVPLLAALLMTGLAYGNGPGDMNCDSVVDFDDIDPFVAALGCPGGDPNCWPGPCPWINGDTNDDGDVTFDDIDPFVALIGTSYPQGEIMPAELAGNTLDLYPYFEYVRAFNENATVELAIDPTRYPDIVGKTADVYMVEAKSAGAWDVDPVPGRPDCRRGAHGHVWRNNDPGEYLRGRRTL